ncbi:hypothetical protein BGZ49_009141, partial [Haplosporangium sp. Z 27]
MGTNQSTSRANKDYSQPHTTGSATRYPTRNNSGTNLDRHGSTSQSGGSIHNMGSSQKSLNRRRSSNKAEPSSSHSSTYNSHHHKNDHMPTHTEEESDYRYIYGRRYHNTSSLYFLPNDTEEVD